MASFAPFQMERWMSLHEREVDFNLSESGVEPVRLDALIDKEELESLLEIPLGYPHVNGLPELRERIASLYEGASPENVLVTVGAAEANYITTRTVLDAGGGISVMLPNYMQIWGIAHNHGYAFRSFHLGEEDGWALDVDELHATVTSGTDLVAICNPNNPTGHILTEPEMEAVVQAAGRADAWILADEVYAGSERVTDAMTPSFFGHYEKVLAVGSLSKAYGLPGLRIGWVVAPRQMTDEIWKRHEYVTISAGALDNRLAVRALEAKTRSRLVARTRALIREGYGRLQAWMDRHPDVFLLTPPEAAAVAFVQYELPISSFELADRLRRDKRVLVVPGEHFGMDRFVRVSFGLPEESLVPALDRFGELIAELQHGVRAP
jgi:aspartate/methionine/tyrosine aminotransferase